jgi:RapA N-terminal Tudor like domain 1
LAFAPKNPASAGFFFTHRWLSKYNAAMLNISPGQRWISAAEPELGLGTILRSDHRQIAIIFTDSGNLKHFTHAASPLLRVRFAVADAILVEGETHRVTAVIDNPDGTTSYQLGEQSLHEGALDSQQRYLPAGLRLLVDQYDAAYLFDLRQSALNAGALEQEPFEIFAIALLRHFGCQFTALAEHRFTIDTHQAECLPAFNTDQPCCFGNNHLEAGVQPIDRDHPLLQAALLQFLDSRAGNACFLIDDTLPARSAVLETVFCNHQGEVFRMALDALGNRLEQYQVSEQALFRSRDSQIDMKPFRRSLAQIYPLLLQASMAENAVSGAGKLEAVRLIVGTEFALFGKKPR